MSHFHNFLRVQSCSYLGDELLAELSQRLRASGARSLPDDEEDMPSEELFGDAHEGALDELIDRLISEGCEGDFFLPVRFSSSIEIEGTRYASAFHLLEALERLRPALGLDLEQDQRPRHLARQRNLWKLFRRGARLATKKRAVLELARF